MSQRKKNEIICGTCKYWGGDTQLSGSDVKMLDEKGNCNHPTNKHGHNHYSTKIGNGCKEWSQKY